MRTAIVITACPGRELNVQAVLESLRLQSRPPELVVLVEDGGPLAGEFPDVVRLVTAKHQPGRDQPRNVGVRHALLYEPEVTHVWFLDSDVLVDPGCLEHLEETMSWAPEAGIAVAPYDWMPAGSRSPIHDLYNDMRWPMFNAYDGRVYTDDLSAGLACFSGNLMWRIDEFQRVGGFWSELHHGRCEDGELGLRAVAMGVPIVLAPLARGWHLWHPENHDLKVQRNERDVPMLNDRHPWVQGRGVFMVDRDGKAFDVRCECGDVVPTIAWWEHAQACGKGMAL
jgi:GT2 family glycosyltransferase